MFFDNFASIRLADQQTLLAPDLRGSATAPRAYAPARAYFDRPNGSTTLLDRLLYADIKTYLVELLMKQDQMSMATSIESRVPFLDHKLVEFAAGLPGRWKLSGLTTKRVLRAAMKGLLPESILTRPKMGFPVPFSIWTRGAWNAVAREVLLDRRSRERGIIDPAAADRLLRDHAEGRTDGGDPTGLIAVRGDENVRLISFGHTMVELLHFRDGKKSPAAPGALPAPPSARLPRSRTAPAPPREAA